MFKTVNTLKYKLLVVGCSALLSPSLALASLCEGMITHTKELKVPLVGKPPFRKYYREPTFGTKVMRITDSSPDQVNKPVYSTVQAWNSDESYMIIYRSGNRKQDHYLVDGHTYQVIKRLNIRPSDLEDIFWSREDPAKLFYFSKAAREHGHFYSMNVESGKRTLIKDFASICPRAVTVPGNNVQMQSMDDDLFGFRCRDNSTKKKKYTAFTYRISTNEVNKLPLGDGTDWKNWTAPNASASGKTVYLQGKVLTPDLKKVIHKLDMGKVSEHGNLGLNHKGEDVMYQIAFDPSPKGCNNDPDKGVAHLAEYNMETGKCRTIISEDRGYPYPTSATHVSAQAYKKPGWVVMSSVGYPKQMKFLDGKKPADTLFSEIYLANTDPDNMVVCRLAHHRSKGKLAENGDYKSYFGEPHVTIRPSGTRVLFGSDWYDSGAVDTYVIELPGYKRP